MKVPQIIPRIAAVGCGVGDYAMLLAGQLEAKHGIKANFLALELGPEAGKNGLSVRQVERRAEALAYSLKGHERVLLHYAGYGYEKRGCPVWLLRGLRTWKKRQARARLTTMFHELYATGLPWQSSFWTSPLQRWICRELAKLSDGIVTNREDSAAILQGMAGRDDVMSLPVFSNVGEPVVRVPMEKREARLVIFGGREWRSTALVRDREEILATCRKWGVTEVVEIGAGETERNDLGLPMQPLGKLPAAEVSAWLSRCRLGFVSYPSNYLEKSGIFAAYAAHGVVPVLPQRSMIPNSLGVMKGHHYLSAAEEGALIEDLELRSQDVFSWYQGHRISEHARIFADHLRI